MEVPRYLISVWQRHSISVNVSLQRLAGYTIEMQAESKFM